MSFRFFKRIQIGNGAGINVSKSGLSTSLRGRYGSFGSRGFSIRTGIPGLSFRHIWSAGFGKNGLVVALAIVLTGIALYIIWNLLYLLVLLIYNAFGLLFDSMRLLVRVIRINALERKLKRDRATYDGNPRVGFMEFSTDRYPERFKDSAYYLHEIAIKDGDKTVPGEPVFVLSFLGTSAPFLATSVAVITWYKLPGQRLYNGDIYCSLKLDDDGSGDV